MPSGHVHFSQRLNNGLGTRGEIVKPDLACPVIRLSGTRNEIDAVGHHVPLSADDVDAQGSFLAALRGHLQQAAGFQVVDGLPIPGFLGVRTAIVGYLDFRNTRPSLADLVN
jgi:hypothetical protein